MAEPAGQVNDRGHEDDAAFESVIAGSPEAIRILARGVRDLVYEVLPATVEVVWARQGSVGWGTGPRKLTEQFAYLLPFKAHVTLGFYRGGELPDPDGLLPGGGSKPVAGKLSMRSVTIGSPDQLRDPALRRLIEAATTTGIPPARR